MIRWVERHDLTIDRFGDDGPFVAFCTCDWFDDECHSPSDAARRYDAHVDHVMAEEDES